MTNLKIHDRSSWRRIAEMTAQLRESTHKKEKKKTKKKNV